MWPFGILPGNALGLDSKFPARINHIPGPMQATQTLNNQASPLRCGQEDVASDSYRYGVIVTYALCTEM